jgi:putative transcriptional regulator
MNDREELSREELNRALTRSQRNRIIAGRLEPGDVAALRRFICLTQEQFAEALGISVHTLRNWEQDRVKPDGPGLALLRIAARHPRIVRENVDSAA